MKPGKRQQLPRSLAGSVPVRMGEMAVSSDPGTVLSVSGLGSCVALIMVSPEQQVAGVAHVVLPSSRTAPSVAPPGKFADTAVPALVARMLSEGADLVLMRAVLVGGSAMFGCRTRSSITAVGDQNIKALTMALGAEGIRLAAAEVGGLEGRSLYVVVAEGRVLAGTIAGETKEVFPAGFDEPPFTRFIAA